MAEDPWRIASGNRPARDPVWKHGWVLPGIIVLLTVIAGLSIIGFLIVTFLSAL